MRVALKGLGVTGVLVFTLFPVYLMIVTAFNGKANAGSRTLWPDEWTFRNLMFFESAISIACGNG